MTVIRTAAEIVVVAFEIPSCHTIAIPKRYTNKVSHHTNLPLTGNGGLTADRSNSAAPQNTLDNIAIVSNITATPIITRLAAALALGELNVSSTSTDL
jgi:hypothetical protein